jgi:hypothetical protein
MTAEELYNLYTSFGDDPFVIVPPGEPARTFSAWDYRKLRPSEMCEAGEDFVAEVTPRVPAAIANADISPHDVV